MTHVSILGTGKMGKAITDLVINGGNTVQTLGSTDTDQVVIGEIVILAVPHPAVSSVVAERGAELAGKIVVDISNPLNFETFDSLTVPADSSAAAELAAALPDSKVLKAFNTNFVDTLVSGKIGDLTTTVQIAGDDSDAKVLLAGVVTAAGLTAIDAGTLKRARELEAIGFLQLTLAETEKISWAGGYGVIA